MVISQHSLSVATAGRGTLDITGQAATRVRESGIRQRIFQIFIANTSASLTLGENADPDVRADLPARWSSVAGEFARRVILIMALIGMMPALAQTDALFCSNFEATTNGLNTQLSCLPENRWQKVHQPSSADWRRQAHAGIAWDSKRDTLLLFGSDTHGSNWSNDVLEFDPLTMQWDRHYPTAGPETYQTDQNFNAIAGSINQPRPWAMHTFDLLIADPNDDSLLLLSWPAHNPRRSDFPATTEYDLTWRYDLSTRQWETIATSAPMLFPGSAAYDSKRDTIVGYFKGLWELGPDRRNWQLANADRNHAYHHMMVYDTTHEKILVFGDFPAGKDVWVYSPGSLPGAPGQWAQRIPSGAAVPQDQHFPVAYDSVNSLTLMVVDQPSGTSAETYTYDYATDQYTQLPDGGLDTALDMNYMMVYDPRHAVFLLVRGNVRAPAAVWALRYEP